MAQRKPSSKAKYSQAQLEPPNPESFCYFLNDLRYGFRARKGVCETGVKRKSLVAAEELNFMYYLGDHVDI